MRVLHWRLIGSIFHLSIVYFWLGLDLLLAGDPDFHPLRQRDEWQLEDPAAWEWQGEGDTTTLVLKQSSQIKPKIRRPFNLAWFGGAEWETFTMTCEVRLDSFNKGNNDLCIAFGARSESEFYYAHLGESADAAHLQLHLVSKSDRKPITNDRAKQLPWQPNHWHSIKMTRDTLTGDIEVFFDGQVVLKANDLTFGKGRIGLGSFDDLGAFRNVVVSTGGS